MDIALTTPVAEGARRLRGVGTGGQVPRGAGGLRAISFAKPNRGLPRSREKNHLYSCCSFRERFLIQAADELLDFLDEVPVADVEGRSVVEGRGLDVEDRPEAVGGVAAGLFGDEGERRGFV